MLSEYETAEVLRNLMAAYPSFAPKYALSEMVAAYHRALADQAPAAVRRAAAGIVSSNKFFPSAFELREAAGNVAIELEGRGIPLCLLDDLGQRYEDECYGFAAALLTREQGAEWSGNAAAEFERLTGRMPWRLVMEISKQNREVFGAFARYVEQHKNDILVEKETWEVCDVG
jgi:hypothetical protein